MATVQHGLKLNPDYHNPDILLNKKDLDGDVAGIYMDVTNRSAGKTTQIMARQMIDFKLSKGKAQFAMLFREVGEVGASAGLYDSVINYYPDLGNEVRSESRANGLYHQLYLDDEPCGVAMPIKYPDKLKKHSPYFQNIELAFMDEMQTEDGKYLTNEPQKLESVLRSIGRGQGQRSRFFKTILASNPVSVMNPYYIYFGIYNRLKPDTKFLRGHGWVGNFSLDTKAQAEAQENKAFKWARNSQYTAYAQDGQYLFDDSVFVSEMKGNFKYVWTLQINGKLYGLRNYYNSGILYVTKKYDKNYKNIITFKHADHNTSTTLVNRTHPVFKHLKLYYENKGMRFDSVETKKDVFDVLAIDIYSQIW